VHADETVYPTTKLAYSTVKYAPSATPTAKNSGTLITYTGAAGRVEVGLMAVVGMAMAAVVAL
jgi:hypothetical protein